MLKRFFPAMFLVSQLLLVPPVDAQNKKAPKAPKQRNLKAGWTMFGPDQDVAMGQEAIKEIESQITLTNDPTLNNYINAIGNRLVASIPNPPFKFQFKVINDPEINAFAVPGGFIYMNSGIVKNADNEGQVAAVMGHEIGHVILRHSANQMSKSMLAQGLLMGAQVVGQMKGGWAGMAGQLGAPLGAQLLMMKFSRNHEKDADAYGARLMANAGWNPIESARFFEKLEALTKGKNAGGVAGWMSSHPPPDNRAKLLEEEILAFPGKKDFNYATGDWERARAAANALTPVPRKAQAAQQQQQGPAPQSQTVQGFSAYRAQSFEVSYPSNWKVAANPEADGALLAPQEGVTQNGGIGFGVLIAVEPYKNRQPTLESETQALIQNLQKQQQMQVTQQPQKRSIDGQPAYLTMMSSQSPLQGGGRELDMLVTVARPNGLWYMVLICPESAWGQQQGTFEKVVGSVRFAR
jgi:beta-barrel assembly-enhancing protease